MAPHLTAEQVRGYALKFLRALYERTGADVRTAVNVAELGASIGLTEMEAVKQVVWYMATKNLLVNELHHIRIAPIGIETVEEALAQPDKAAAPYLPAINVINAENLHIAVGGQLMQGSGNLRQVSNYSADTGALEHALDKIADLARQLGDAERRQITSLVETARIEAQKV